MQNDKNKNNFSFFYERKNETGFGQNLRAIAPGRRDNKGVSGVSERACERSE